MATDGVFGAVAHAQARASASHGAFGVEAFVLTRDPRQRCRLIPHLHPAVVPRFPFSFSLEAIHMSLVPPSPTAQMLEPADATAQDQEPSVQVHWKML